MDTEALPEGDQLNDNASVDALSTAPAAGEEASKRRRGRRKVMKKVKVKDEEGYFGKFDRGEYYHSASPLQVQITSPKQSSIYSSPSPTFLPA